MFTGAYSCIYGLDEIIVDVRRGARWQALTKHLCKHAPHYCNSRCEQTGKHPQGTEVKAITYSNMQILPRECGGGYEIFCSKCLLEREVEGFSKV